MEDSHAAPSKGRDTGSADVRSLVVPARRARTNTTGSVALVGAGPGDPELLTLKALRLIEQADAIVYDRLVAAEIVALARPGAQLIYAGKQRAHHTLTQEAIGALLVRLAREGKRVVRLKGGDPFIFGRGGEEIEILAAHAIPFEVVPGISAANGVAAYAGIPLTHRDCAQACVFVTGHLCNGTMDLDWPALARPRQTLVVYMGLLGLPVLSRELVAHGLAADTPAAIVQHGTSRTQRVLVDTIATLPAAAAAAGFEAPTLIIIGDVVRLHRTLAWFTPAPPALGVTAMSSAV